MLRMDEINKIRKQVLIQGKTRNQVAIAFNHSWDTINRLIQQNIDNLKNRGKRPNKKHTVMTDVVMKEINDLLDYEDSVGVKKKQRRTALQIYKELTEKNIYHGSQRRMQEVVSALRKKRGQIKKPGFLPLDFPIGSALQVDHGEVEIEVNKQRVKAYLFVASVPGQALRYCQVFPIKAKEAWGAFHEKSFIFFGGIFDRVIYDNDTVVVKIVGKQRKQTTFSMSMEEHYGFESHFCNPSSGHEKGAVENAVGYCRRNFLSGLPAFKNWDDVNKWLEDCCIKDIKEKNHYKTHQKLSDLLCMVKAKLHPLRPKKSWYDYLDCRVDKFQCITVNYHKYSVPEGFVGSKMRVAVTHDRIEIMEDNNLIIAYERKYTSGDSLTLDHYLNQLQRKPRAFTYAKPVKEAVFHDKFLEMRTRLFEKYEEKQATSEFVELLLLQRRWNKKDVIESVGKALDLGAIDAASVENILRQKTLTPNINKEEMQKLSSIPCMKWEFHLNAYRELCEEVTL